LCRTRTGGWRIYFNTTLTNGIYYSDSDDLSAWTSPTAIGTLSGMSHGTVYLVVDFAAYTTIVNLLGYSGTGIPEAPIDGNPYARKDAAWDIISLSALGDSVMAASAWRAATQSIPNNAYTAVSFDTEIRDDGSIWSSGSPTRFTAPVDGWYVIAGSVSWSARTGYSRRLIILLDGSSWIGKSGVPAPSDYNDPAQSVAVVYYMTAGQYVEFAVLQNSGSSLNLAAYSIGSIGLISSGIPDAPADGNSYVRKDNAWVAL
jgi:hypothetical protein